MDLDINGMCTLRKLARSTAAVAATAETTNDSSITSFLLCSGNDFCGTVPSAFAGARLLESTGADGFTDLVNVTSFNNTCPVAGSSHHAARISKGAIAGMPTTAFPI